MNTRIPARLLSLLFPMAALLAAGAQSCGKSQGSSNHDAGPALTAKVVTIQSTMEPDRYEVVGQVVARNRVEVASKIAGHIAALPVTEGSRVKKGDLLARVDAPELLSALAQAQSAEDAARLEWETAQRQAERYRRLAKGEVVTPRDLELAISAEAGANANYERAKALREMSERNLSYSELRAGSPGVVVQRMVREGDLATPGRTLLVMEETGAPEVRITVPAQSGARLAPGSPAEILSDPEGSAAVSAVVDRVTPSAVNHTLEAFLRGDGIPERRGTFVTVALFGDSVKAIRVPPEALVHRGPLSGVFVVRDGRAALRWLRLGSGGRVEAGLSPGDSVVVAPPATLESGRLIQVAS
jgi:RND family efflux transporter MFP subunit